MEGAVDGDLDGIDVGCLVGVVDGDTDENFDNEGTGDGTVVGRLEGMAVAVGIAVGEILVVGTKLLVGVTEGICVIGRLGSVSTSAPLLAWINVGTLTDARAIRAATTNTMQNSSPWTFRFFSNPPKESGGGSGEAVTV